MMDSRAPTMYVLLDKITPMKMDACSLQWKMFATIQLNALMMYALLLMKTLIMMVVFTDQSTPAVTMDSDAPEIFAVLTLKMPLMVVLMKVWTLNAMMDLLALKTLVHQET